MDQITCLSHWLHVGISPTLLPDFFINRLFIDGQVWLQPDVLPQDMQR